MYLIGPIHCCKDLTSHFTIIVHSMNLEGKKIS